MSLIFSSHFDVFCDLLLNRRTATWNLFLLCTCNKKDTILQKSFFYFKIFLYNSKASLCLIYCLSKIKRSHWLLCAAKNCDFSWKIMSLPRLESSGRLLWNEVENYSDREGIFALRSQQIVKKMLKKTIQFLSSEEPCESDVRRCLEHCNVERIRLENLWLRSTLEAIRFEFWILKGALVPGQTPYFT